MKCRDEGIGSALGVPIILEEKIITSCSMNVYREVGCWVLPIWDLYMWAKFGNSTGMKREGPLNPSSVTTSAIITLQVARISVVQLLSKQGETFSINCDRGGEMFVHESANQIPLNKAMTQSEKGLSRGYIALALSPTHVLWIGIMD